MPRYLSQHTLACLTRQGAEELSKKILGAKSVTGRRVLVNMQEGKMLAEFDAPSREEMEKWLTTEKFHFDWLLRLEYESATDAALRSHLVNLATERSDCSPRCSGCSLNPMKLRHQTCAPSCCLCCTDVCSGAGG